MIVHQKKQTEFNAQPVVYGILVEGGWSQGTGVSERHSLGIVRRLDGGDGQLGITGQVPVELYVFDVGPVVGVEHVDKEALDALVLWLANDGAVRGEGDVVVVGAGISVVIGLGLIVGVLVLVVLDVSLLDLAWNVLAGDLGDSMVMDVLVLGLLGGLGFVWRHLWLGLSTEVGDWLLVVHGQVLPDVVVDLHRAFVLGTELLPLQTSEVSILGAEPRHEVIEQIHVHLEVPSKLLLGVLQPEWEHAPHQVHLRSGERRLQPLWRVAFFLGHDDWKFGKKNN